MDDNDERTDPDATPTTSSMSSRPQGLGLFKGSATHRAIRATRQRVIMRSEPAGNRDETPHRRDD